MLEDRSSFVSKSYSGETNQWAAYGIEGLEFRQEKQPSDNNQGEEVLHNLELSLACGGFSVASPPQDGNSNVDMITHQFNKNDGLDLGLGTLLVQSIPPPQPVDTSSLIDAIGRDISISCLLRCPRAAYGSIASLNRSFRELIKSEEIYKLRYDNKVIEHLVYFCCDLTKWEAFDPSNRKWMQIPIIDTDACYKCTLKESMAVGTQLLVLGRGLMGHTTYKYSLLTNSWSLGQVMNVPRVLFGSASLGQVAIFAGGVTQTGNIMDVVELYDSRSGTWEMLPSMIKPRKLCSGVYMDGKFYAIGGIGNKTKSLSCGEEYDLDNKKWTVIPNMSPVKCRGGMAPPLVAVVGNELYAADPFEMKLKTYDKKRKVWEVIGWLPERAHSIDGWGMAFRGCGERVIVVGGPPSFGPNVVEIYSWAPSKGPPKWSMIGWKRSHSFVFNCSVMSC